MYFDLARKYARYYLHAKTKHGIHSPFVYDLVTKVLEDKEVYPHYKQVEDLRINLLANKMVTEITDYGAGAGSGEESAYQKKVSEIAAKTAKPAKWGKLLYRLAKYFAARDILELGTSLGISAGYIARGAKHNGSKINFHSIEGSPNLAEMAGINLKNLGLEDEVKVVCGKFTDALPQVLDSYSCLDMVFIDGDHRKEPTLEYFKQILPKAHNDTIFIFDDIHWSNGMSEAWEAIKEMTEVTVTIDLFYMGLVFIRRQQAREHFIVRF